MPDYLKKIMSWDEARSLTQRGKTVFTNGCFDLLHAGHVSLLSRARELGDLLILGLNSDSSVQQIKGDTRPIVPQNERAAVLAGLAAIDAVVIFEEPDPLKLITHLNPDILIKGEDWSLDKVIGREVVEKNGGKVINLSLTPGLSSTEIIRRIREN
jgi:rfaE bifunctional protein nucleotidyltransferase chain/domain